MSPSPDTAVLERIRAEYLEMPGMRLKVEQVRRLCGVDRSVCGSILNALVEAGFLCLNPDGTYARLTDSSLPLRPLKAELASGRSWKSRRAS